MKKQRLYILVLLSILGAMGCQKKPDTPYPTIEELKAQALAEKIDRFKKETIQRCYRDAYERAREIADSTLIARAKATRPVDSRPPKPSKPPRPDWQTDMDSIPLEPLLEE